MTGEVRLLGWASGSATTVAAVSLTMRGLATPLPCLRRRRALSRNGRGLVGLPIAQSRVPAACGPAPTRAGGCGWGLVGHGGGPEEAGEFARDGDGGDVAGLTAL